MDHRTPARLRGLLLSLVLLCATSTASAADNLWLGVKAGTLGAGLEATWRPIEWLDVRLGANLYEFDNDGSQSGIGYDGTFHLESYYGTANLRFPLSPLRLTAGIFSNANEVTLISQPAPTYNIGGTTYTATEVGTLNSLTVWEDMSPYVGAGFDFELMGRLGLSFDFGVLLQGDPIVTLSSDGTLAGDPAYQAALEQERLELVEEADALKAYPALSVGITFNFF